MNPSIALLGLAATIALGAGSATAQTGGKTPAKPTAAVSTKSKPPAAIKLPAGVVARVNNRDITRVELIELLNRSGARETVQKLIQMAVLQEAARRYGVAVTPAEVAEQVRTEKNRIVASMMQQTGTPMTFAEITSRYGLTEAEIEWTVRLQLLGRKAFGKTIEKEVQPIDNQIRAEHILLLTMPQPGPDGKPPVGDDQAKRDADARTKLEGIVADIKAGKITFEDAAKKFSDDKASAVEGGMLPWFAKNGMMVPEFENAAFALKKPGEISPIVKTQYGVHVIKLVRLGKDASPAEKKKYKDDELAKLVGNGARFQQWLAAAVQKATITLDPAGLKLKP
ncbi:MAG: peptidylprolyl isomerase [Armatimonadota bacterium]